MEEVFEGEEVLGEVSAGRAQAGHSSGGSILPSPVWRRPREAVIPSFTPWAATIGLRAVLVCGIVVYE